MAEYSHLIGLVQMGTFATTTDKDLLAALSGCVDINGPNPLTLERIKHAREVIQWELSQRESRRQHFRILVAMWASVSVALAVLIFGVLTFFASRSARVTEKPPLQTQNQSASNTGTQK
jgi:hypothetical protein